MKGCIKTIQTIASGNREFGFILGEDNNEYYFDNRSIPAGRTTLDFSEKDIVEFDVIAQPDKKNDRATNLNLIDISEEETNDYSDSSSSPFNAEDSSNDNDISEIEQQAPIKFYKAGFFKHIDKERMYAEHLRLILVRKKS